MTEAVNVQTPPISPAMSADMPPRVLATAPFSRP
jgi:hypothetical protein